MLPKETTDETLELEGGVRLELQRPPADDAEEQAKRANDGVYRDQKKVKDMNADIAKIMEKIQEMHDNARLKLKDHRKKMWSQLDENLTRYREGLKAEKAKQEA